MTIRQLWVRVKALPADSPLHVALAAERERQDAERREQDIDDALNRYRTKG